MPKMIPGQEPYTETELQRLYRLIADAAEGDPGEEGEREVLRKPFNHFQWCHWYGRQTREPGCVCGPEGNVDEVV